MHWLAVGCLLLVVLVTTTLTQDGGDDQSVCGQYFGDQYYSCDVDNQEACDTRGCCWDDETQQCYHSTDTVYTDGNCTYVLAHHAVEGYACLCKSLGQVDDGDTKEACLQEACNQNTNGVNAVNFDAVGGSCYVRKCEIPLINDNLALNDQVGDRNIWVRVLDYCQNLTICGPGTCQQTSTRTYSCLCPDGLTGFNCQQDINECEGVACENEGECVDALNSYSCDCHDGFDGLHCEMDNYNCAIEAADTIDCNSTTMNDCHFKGCCWVNGSCFHGHNTTMMINENCTYIRVHKADEGLASYCSDDSPVSSKKDSLQQCLTEACTGGDMVYNTVNMHLGESCYLRYCETPLIQEHLKLDVTTSEHVGRDIWIKVLDYCSEGPCDNDGICVNTERYFTCECQPGYEGDTCQTDINECQPSPCLHGDCIDLVNEYTCQCTEGYTGGHCELEIQECVSNPCDNGGTCHDEVNRFTCECVEGYTSDRCEINIDDCAESPCVFGSCEDGVNQFTCHCASSHTGQLCQQEINECDSNPCQNEGTCSDHVDSFSCECVAGYTGENCEQDIDECSSNPCVEGECTHDIDAYSCQCYEGFTGTNCETDIDDCENVLCGEGQCTDGANEYSCECFPGYTGTNCDTEIDECESNPCLNGATCTEGLNYFTCSCPDGYTGTQCETDELNQGSADALEENSGNGNQDTVTGAGIIAGSTIAVIVAGTLGALVLVKVVLPKLKTPSKVSAEETNKTDVDADQDELATQPNNAAPPITYVNAYIPNS